jgi:hypothetical protein
MAEPRVIGMPKIPDDIKRVRDVEGEEWVRASRRNRTWRTVGAAYVIVEEAELIYHYGELTEVTDDGST